MRKFIIHLLGGITQSELAEQQADCCYFYRETDEIPKHAKDVMTCGETDPEAGTH